MNRNNNEIESYNFYDDNNFNRLKKKRRLRENVDIEIKYIKILPEYLNKIHPVVLSILEKEEVEIPEGLTDEERDIIIFQCREIGKLMYKMSGILKSIKNLYS